MFKRVVLVTLVALVASGCHFLDPRPGFGPVLTVHVTPPGAGGARAVDVSASDLAHGTAVRTEVHLDARNGPVIASGTTLPLHFDLDVNALSPTLHVLYVKAKVKHDDRRRGLGIVDERVRLNQLQALGTHNSYHTYPAPPLDGVESLDYFEDPLDVQLQDQGVRQFELDVNIGDPGGEFQVFHVQGLDTGTTCFVFTDCLDTIKTWSQAHPQHAPIAILLELKDNDYGLPSPNRNWVQSDLDRLDTTIRSVFSEDRMFTPDDLRGSHTSLADAVTQDGWPAIDAVRGQVMFLMDNGGTFRSWYRDGHPGLAGRVLFTNASPGADDAAFVERNDSKGSFADIQSLVAEGYVIRTRADADTVEARNNDTSTRDAAIASGAQWVSSDYVVPGRAFGNPYVVQIPGGTPDRCNPINTPTTCTSALVESLP
ncbi:MAG: Ca2+-dependent phosphoinositide-specific phospholipase C [Acidimicrobiia bacterium]